MMLADSNIIIYAGSENYNHVLTWLLNELPAVSAITMVETLGYYKLNESEKANLINIFRSLKVIYPTTEVFSEAINLRQQRKISLGDALIAATAIKFDLPLATHNTEDFRWIKKLILFDPL